MSVRGGAVSGLGKGITSLTLYFMALLPLQKTKAQGWK